MITLMCGDCNWWGTFANDYESELAFDAHVDECHNSKGQANPYQHRAECPCCGFEVCHSNDQTVRIKMERHIKTNHKGSCTYYYHIVTHYANGLKMGNTCYSVNA